MVKIRLSGIQPPPTEKQNTKISIPIKNSQKNDSKSSVPKITVKTGAASTVPRIKVKTRKVGDGYDSEAPDREDDPMSEEAIILRMVPGDHLNYLRAAVDSGDLSQINIKFKDARRAVVTVAGQMFAAKLVDLPTVTETFKTFDKKNIYKVSDICQMLLVVEGISKEEDVFKVIHDDNVQWPHGVAPPLFNVKKERFRKRVSNKVIETVEARVDELFRLDDEADETQYELLNPAVLALERSDSGSPLHIEDDDEVEEAGDEEGDEDDENVLGQELEKALVESEEEEDSESDDDDDDEDEDEDMDDDEREEFHHHQLLQDEIKELESTIASKQRDADNTVNQIMKGRLLEVVNKLRQELDMKKRQLPTEAVEKQEEGARLDINGGEEEEDDDDDDGELDALF